MNKQDKELIIWHLISYVTLIICIVFKPTWKWLITWAIIFTASCIIQIKPWKKEVMGE